MQRQHFLRAAVAATVTATLALTTLGAAAQAWPSKPVKFIIPFPPGGTLDTVGRMLAQKLQEQLGQTFIVENRAGGNGMIGSRRCGQGSGRWLHAAVQRVHLHHRADDGEVRTLRRAARLRPGGAGGQAPLAVSVNNNLPVNDIKGLMAYAKANPGKLNFAIGSTGSAGTCHRAPACKWPPAST
jgi:tripartite-type tricarboxylate transporter receptor subunit TctC